MPFAEAAAATYAPTAVGDAWGPAWGTSWFRVTGTVPDDARSPELVLDLGWDVAQPGFQAEALARRADGRVVKGLNPQNSWLPARPGERVELYVEAAANPTLLGPSGFRPTEQGDRLTADDRPLYRVARAEVVERDLEVAALAADLDVVDGLSRTLPESDARRWELLRAAERALDALDHHDVAGTAARARAELADVLAAPARASAHRVSAVGHAHIDSAWLWPLRETVRKVLRTVANVVHLLDTTDDLVYAMSSAQQWEWVRVHDPDLFDRVKAHAAAGRFVPAGGMWVESDTNMVGGEAMARQLQVGQEWFAEHLGAVCEEVWLPDSFGYTAALPQLVRQAGCRWFLTQKISWNRVNVFPHHTFWWEGIDGTRVLTHFPPVDTYTSTLSAAELAHAAANFRDKGAASRSLVPFGHGDGGGGPTREMLERARRTADLDGSPRVTVESPTAFFTAAEAEYADAPAWVGELYLEIHRGTYTSQARTKQGNRRSEHLLREAELWAATAAVRGLAPYPAETLAEAWRTVLLHQFHDILPGSSIAWVHREAVDTYAEVAATLESVIDSATAALAGDGTDEVAFNAGPVVRAGVPALGADGGTRRPRATRPVRDGDDVVLDNGLLRVRVDRDGLVRSVLDLRPRPRGRPPGRGGGTPAAAPRHPERLGRLGPRRVLPAHRARPRRRRRARRRRRRRHLRVRRPRPPATDLAAGRRGARRRRDRGRLAGERGGAQARLRRRRAHRPRPLRDPVRARRAAHAREHQLGRRPVRGVRAPVGARGRGRVRRGRRERRHLRARRVPAAARGRRHLEHGAPEPAAGAALPRPAHRPRHATCCAAPSSPAAGVARRPPRATGSTCPSGAGPAPPSSRWCGWRAAPRWSRPCDSPATARATWWCACTSPSARGRRSAWCRPSTASGVTEVDLLEHPVDDGTSLTAGPGRDGRPAAATVPGGDPALVAPMMVT